MGSEELISIVKVEDQSDIYEKVRSGFNLIGKPALDQDAVIAIKPNLCCIKGPETGATTDLRVVEAIIRYLQDEFHVSDISIIESDGTQLLADMAFKLLGYERLCKKLGVKLVNLSKSPFSYKTFEKNSVMKKVKVPDIFERVTCLISVPKIKIHTLCSMGGTMKNQYGCNPVPKKTRYHSRLHECIVDFTAVFKPQLIVVDGIIGMEGCGPVSGIPVKMNTLIFGKDALAIDHLIARLIGLNPNKIQYLMQAQKRKLGTTNYRLVGSSFKEVEHQFNFPPKRSNLYGLFNIK